jgi:hypothetical protein
MVYRTSSGSCLMAGFGTGGVETSDSDTSVIQLDGS